MLSFNQQYDIAHGVFLTFDQHLEYRLLKSKHKAPTRARYERSFPVHKWEARKRETLVIACIYIMLTKNPSSFNGLLDELREVDIKDVAKFKHVIMNYDFFIKKDVEYLKEKHGTNIDAHTILKEYAGKNIQFYTAWWFIKLHCGDNPKMNRTDKFIFQKIRSAMLFLTFKEESIQKIKDILDELEI